MKLFIAVVASQTGFEPATRCLEGRVRSITCLRGILDTNVSEKPPIFAARGSNSVLIPPTCLLV